MGDFDAVGETTFLYKLRFDEASTATFIIGSTLMNVENKNLSLNTREPWSSPPQTELRRTVLTKPAFKQTQCAMLALLFFPSAVLGRALKMTREWWQEHSPFGRF